MRLYALFLFLIFTLVFGTALLVSYFDYRSTVTHTKRLHASTAELLARLVLEHEKRLFDIAETNASRSSFIKAVQGRESKDIDDHLVQIRQRYDVNTVLVSDPQGLVLATSPPRSYLGDNISEGHPFKGVTERYHSYLSPAFHRQEDERDLVTAVATPIISDQGSLLGMLILFERATLFEAILKDLTVEPGTKVSIIDQLGHIVYKNKDFKSDSIMDHPMAGYVTSMGEKGFLDLRREESFTSVFSYVPIPQIGWGIILEIEKREIVRRLYPTFVKIAGVSTLFFLVIVLSIHHLRKTLLSARRLEAERMRLALAVEQAADGISIISRRGIIEYANPSFLKMTGYERGEIQGAGVRVLQGPAHTPEFYDDLWSSLKASKVWTGRVDTRRKDNSSFQSLVTMSAVSDPSGEIVSYVCLARDISEEVKEEKHRRQAQKMEAMGTLASGIAHDFNNILAAIVGFSELALEDMKDTVPEKRFLRNIYHAGIRGRDLVKQILAFSRKTEQEQKPILLAPILTETLKLMRASISANIEIRQDIPADEQIVLADPVQIQQMVMNLCVNAAYAMREQGGVLEVCLSDCVIDKTSAPPDTKPGSYFKISVKDNGPGISHEIQERIFDPFFTTKKQGEGTGLGLSVVHTIAQSLKGAVTLRSKPGKGAAFDIYLPKMTMTMTEQEDQKQEQVEGKDECILFVDDEPAITEMGKRMIERLGYRVVAETDSVEALRRFEEQPDAFDMVITDQAMPVVTGIELSQRCLSIRPGLPIILCTGYSEIVSPERARQVGIKEFLSKPVVKTEMAKTIRKALDASKRSRDQKPSDLKTA